MSESQLRLERRLLRAGFEKNLASLVQAGGRGLMCSSPLKATPKVLLSKANAQPSGNGVTNPQNCTAFLSVFGRAGQNLPPTPSTNFAAITSKSLPYRQGAKG